MWFEPLVVGCVGDFVLQAVWSSVGIGTLYANALVVADCKQASFFLAGHSITGFEPGKD